MTKNLKQRVVYSGSWVIVGHLLSQVIRLSGNLILTRLLVPEMFGVMAIVTVIMTGLAMFSDVGLLQNIIQSKRGEESAYLNTAWTIQIIRGFLIFFIALLFSVGIYYAGELGYFSTETVYGNAQLPLLLAVVSITAVISSFNSIHILLLNRKLMLGKLITIEISSQIFGLIFMVIWAWYQRDVWALVFGGIVAAFAKMFISHVMRLGERCKFYWDREAVYEIFHFGKWIFISSILGFLLSQGDRLLLGFWVTPEELGVYSIAFFLAMAIKEILKKLVGSVFYPMLSEIVRDNPEQLRELYYKIRARVDFIAMMAAGLMTSMGHIVINILYDQRYVEAGWMIEVLSFSLIFIGYSMAGVCLMAKGNVKSNMWLTLNATIFLYFSVPIAYSYYGLYGAIVMVSINFIIDIPSTFYMLKKYDLLLISKEFRMLPVLGISYGFGVLAVNLFGL